MIVGLAAYERAADQVRFSAAQLEECLFGADPAAAALVAEQGGPSQGSRVVGFALYYRSFSTWEGPGIYLEDLFVEPDHRGSGLGRALLGSLAALTANRGYARLEWAVLDWNAPSLDFYRRMGAEVLSEWQIHRLSGAALQAAGLRRSPVRPSTSSGTNGPFVS